MKFLPYTVFVIISFLGVAVFGSFGMEQSMLSGHGGCVALAAGGVFSCVEGVNSFMSANFHIGILKAFSMAIVSFFAAGFLFVYGATRFFGAMRVMRNAMHISVALQRVRNRFLEIFQVFSSFLKQAYWFEKRCHSPSLKFGS